MRFTGGHRPRSRFVPLIAALAVCVPLWLWFAVHFPDTAWDFTGFYIAGNIPLHQVHDQQVFQNFGNSELAPLGVRYYPPYVRPSVFAVPLHLIMSLPYWTAYWLWAAAQLLAFLSALWLLQTRLHLPVGTNPIWAIFFPAWFGIITGQDALGVLLIVVAGIVFIEKGRDGIGGALLALTLYKFNLSLLIPVALMFRGKWHALASYAVVGAGLAAASALVEAPSKYLELLRTIGSYTVGFRPETMLGLRGLAHFLHLPWLYFLLAPLTIAAAAWKLRRSQDLPESIGIALTASILCAWHGTWYDGALLALPAALLFHCARTTGRVVAAIVLALPFWNAFPQIATLAVVGLFAAQLALKAGSSQAHFST